MLSRLLRPAVVLFCLVVATLPAQAQSLRDLPGALDATPLDPPSFRTAPWDALFVSVPFPTWVRDWTVATQGRLERERRAMLRDRRLGRSPGHGDLAGLEAVEAIDAVQTPADAAVDSTGEVITMVADSLLFMPPRRVRQERHDPTLGPLSEYADLGIRVRGSGDFGGAWTRYNPCEQSLHFNCNPGLFPQLKPDVQFSVEVRGTISERVHVDVDYDQAREFDAANNINVYYRGLTDEVLQRVEVGDVSIRLPSSRYLTRGIPAGNFGLMASGQFGPLDFQTVFAQQKGDMTTREFKLGTGGNQAGLEQDATLVLDDADYVKGQFFFLLDPALLRGHPHVDVLQLVASDAPASARPGAGGLIEVYRDERLTGPSQVGQLGIFLAEATPPGNSSQRHTGLFRRLVPEQDYIVHSSGLWITLRAPLRPDEALAVSYLTETGDTVGRLNAEASPPGTTPRLQLLRGPHATHQPGSGTWDLEMHQVYRLDNSTEVDLNTIDLRISLGQLAGGQTFRDVLGQQLSFLKFFGLDEDSPADRIDAAQIYQPAREAFGGSGGTPIGGTFIVLPTLRPFAAPGPSASARLSAAELAAALDRDANFAIYDDPDPVNRAAAGRFRLNFAYRVKVDGLVTSFSLGAFGMREGSERLTFGNRQLERGVDYTIDYDIGTVTLTNAQALFGAADGAELRATWEQKPMFSIAPTSVFGATARYTMGPRGELNFVGLYQQEKTLMTRPQLGAEPGTAFLGGVSGRFDLGGVLIDRFIGGIPGLRGNRASSATLSGELAFSMPNPNRSGSAWLDDFEALDEIALRPRRQDWKLGSAPQSSDGDRGVLPFTRDAATAAPLVWQHDFVQNGVPAGGLMPSRDIDRNINVVGNELPEAVMWLTFGRGANDPSPLPDPGDPRRWRSITTLLSTTGMDMSRSEYIEFYASAATDWPLALVFDVGTVGEDAFHIDSLGQTSGVYPDGRRWGLGVLDEEARLIDREVWGTDKDRLGLWDQNCLVDPLVAYPLGDPRANCTRGNGIPDTEDLNGNGILDADDGQYFRYVVRLDELSEYMVRDTSQTQTGFRLYRIPLRSGVGVNGANEGTWRFIRHLRLTVAGEPQGVRGIALARMRIVGSRWTKRDVHGVQRGLLEAAEGSPLTDVRVGPASRVTLGGRYISPPAVGDEISDRSSNYGAGGAEINEKSLRITYEELQPDERAEVYFRYPQQPRNLLMYRELRLWVMPVAGQWGPAGDERFTLRIGTDPRNYYLYQTRLRPPLGDRAATQADWLPEIVIDFEEWFRLKADAERLLIERGPRTSGVDTLWSADSTYALVLEDRARAPNLAAVRELVFAVYNAGGLPTTGEVWVNELRIGRADTQPGGAGNLHLDIVAGDFTTLNFSVANQGALFRQLGETPQYVGGADLSMSADTRLDRLLPARWGIDLPLSVAHSRNLQAPRFLPQSDVEADRLRGVRESGADVTRIGLRISKRNPSANPWLGLLVDGTALRVGWNTSSNRNIMSKSESSSLTGDLSYRRDLVRRDFGALPGFTQDVLRSLLPDAIENSDAFRRMLASRLRWSPATLSFGSSYNDHLTRSFRYDRILALPGDSAVQPIESPRQGLRNDVQLGMRPFDPLTVSLSLASDRDLLATERATPQTLERSALDAARSSLGGFDVGWETARVLGTSINYRPELTRWLRVGYSYSNRYITDRNPSWLEIREDSTATMQRRFESSRQTSRTVNLQGRGLAFALGLDSVGLPSRLLQRVEAVDFAWRNGLSSQFERMNYVPGIGYQVGFGGYDDFRIVRADTANRAQQRDQFSASTAFSLVPGTRVELGYNETETLSFDARGGTRTTQEVGWPRITLSARALPLPTFLSGFIIGASGSAGVQRTEREQVFAAATTPQVRGGTELSFPLSLTINMPRGILFSWRGSFSSGETLEPTGNSQSGGRQQDLTIAASIQPPQAWRERLNAPLTLSFTFSEQNQRQCRFSAFFGMDADCIAFLDLGTRSANMRVESKISDLDVGLLLNWVNRQNHVGTRTGSSQFQLGLYGRFSLEAGRMPLGGLR